MGPLEDKKMSFGLDLAMWIPYYDYSFAGGYHDYTPVSYVVYQPLGFRKPKSREHPGLHTKQLNLRQLLADQIPFS